MVSNTLCRHDSRCHSPPWNVSCIPLFLLMHQLRWWYNFGRWYSFWKKWVVFDRTSWNIPLDIPLLFQVCQLIGWILIMLMRCHDHGMMMLGSSSSSSAAAGAVPRWTSRSTARCSTQIHAGGRRWMRIP